MALVSALADDLEGICLVLLLITIAAFGAVFCGKRMMTLVVDLFSAPPRGDGRGDDTKC